MQKIIRGIVHGKIIELNEDLGLAEGREVELVVKPLPHNPTDGGGWRRCAGALADDWTDEDDRILHEIYLDRKRDTRRDILE